MSNITLAKDQENRLAEFSLNADPRRGDVSRSRIVRSVRQSLCVEPPESPWQAKDWAGLKAFAKGKVAHGHRRNRRLAVSISNKRGAERCRLRLPYQRKVGVCDFNNNSQGGPGS